VKSGRICDLIAFRFLYVMSRGDNSIPIRRHVLLPKGCSIYWRVVLR
jgi:hypothetical protein